MISSGGPSSRAQIRAPVFWATARATITGATAQISAQSPRQENTSSSMDIWLSTRRGLAPLRNQKECHRSYSGFQGARTCLEGSSRAGCSTPSRPLSAPASSTMGSRNSGVVSTWGWYISSEISARSISPRATAAYASLELICIYSRLLPGRSWAKLRRIPGIR